MSLIETKPTFCRNCSAFCPVIVTFEDGRPVKVAGDPSSTIFEGYTCPKGRAMPEQYNDPRRILVSQKRQPDGSYAPISSDQAVDEIAEKLKQIIDDHGPRAISAYFGSGLLSTFFGATMSAFLLQAMGSPMHFNAAPIDKPGEKISLSLHGNWHAGAQAFGESDVLLLVGANPVIAKSNGAPYNNPGMRLKEAVNGGMKLLVIDPRKTETSRRAHVHLQALPGEDPTILAGLIRIIIAEGLYDAAFVAENAEGFETLKAGVEPFTPDYVADRAGISVEDLLETARTFGRANKGGVICSTGPSFSMHGNLSFYLGLCLNTICGRWSRAGDKATYPNILLPAYTPRAQPMAPFNVFGKAELTAKGVRQSAAGMPTAALPDEMLLDDENRVRALLCIGGNPASSWPDQHKTEAGLKNLDLLVQFDVMMSQTARLAHYVIASPLALEAPMTTYLSESMKYLGVSRGVEAPWAQYTPALLPHPPGSDLIEEHAFFFRVAQKLGLQLNWTNAYGNGPHQEVPMVTGAFDMTGPPPTLDEMWDLLCQGGRIPLDEVKKHPNGALFEVDVVVAPKEEGCTARLQLAAPMMMEDLAQVFAEDYAARTSDAEFPFQLTSRRVNNFMNSLLVGLPVVSKKGMHNPLWLHSDDMARLGVADGDKVQIRSVAGEVLALVEKDDTMRPGVVSMTHGFGGRGKAAEDDPRIAGTNVNLLVPSDEFDPVSGIPRMSAIAVAIIPVRADAAAAA